MMLQVVSETTSEEGAGTKGGAEAEHWVLSTMICAGLIMVYDCTIGPVDRLTAI